MPFYADAQFNTPVLVPVPQLGTYTAVGTSTALASALTIIVFPTFIRRTAINNIQVTVVTAPNAGATATKINFLNGTSTFGVATIGTLTAGQVASAAMTVANSTFAAAGVVTATAVSTATTTGVAGGVYAIWFDQQELYA